MVDPIKESLENYVSREFFLNLQGSFFNLSIAILPPLEAGTRSRNTRDISWQEARAMLGNNIKTSYGLDNHKIELNYENLGILCKGYDLSFDAACTEYEKSEECVIILTDQQRNWYYYSLIENLFKTPKGEELIHINVLKEKKVNQELNYAYYIVEDYLFTQNMKKLFKL